VTLKWWNKKRTFRLLSAAALALLAVVGGVVYFLSSPDFEQFGADYIVAWIEERTGTAVTLERFDADFRRQRFALEGLVLRGDEDPADPPLASIDRVEIGLSWMGLFRRSLDLSSLSIERPEIFIAIDADEDTNVPVLPSRSESDARGFQLTIDELVVVDGSLNLDERRVDIDFSLASLEGAFEYAGLTGVLSGHVEYEGAVDRLSRPLIPYSLSADFDYTGGTVLVETAEVVSGESSMTLQGRIDEVLRGPAGQLGYTGSLELAFLNYFFVDDDLAGRMDTVGDLEFSVGRFYTVGRVRSDGLGVGPWSGANLSSDFEYSFPERTLVATDLEADVLGGRTRGTAAVLSLPGPSRRVELDLNYEEIDTTQLRRIYPWRGPYVVTSEAGGTLAGWFEGRFARFDFQGNSQFESVSGTEIAGTVSLPISGSTFYHGVPGAVEVTGLVAQLGSTAFEADGLIDGEATALDFVVESEDFRDLGFLYGPANGRGRLQGVMADRIREPDISGSFSIVDHNYGDREIDLLEGRATLTPDEIDMVNVSVVDGDSEVRVNGSYDRNLGVPDISVDIVRLAAPDLRQFVDQPVDGVVSGDLRLSSIEPLRFDAQLASAAISYDGHRVGRVEAVVTFGPNGVQAEDVVVEQGTALLTGEVLYQPGSGGLVGSVALSGHRLEDWQWLGVPSGLAGGVRTASFRVDGTLGVPQVEGQAVVEDFQFREQYFPEAVLEIEPVGAAMRARIQTGPELSLSAEIDTAADGYPFQGTASFVDYGADRPAGLSSGSLTATGSASFGGQLLDMAALEGSGQVTDLTVRFQDRDLRVSQPFTFEFDTQRVQVSSIELTGDATALVLEGTVALSDQAPLDLSVRGSVDLSLVASGYRGLEAAGTVVLDGQVGGNLTRPELGGIATLEGVSLGHESLFLSLSALSGNLFFDGNRVNLNDIRGNAGGGDVTLRGTVGVVGAAPGDFDIRLDASNVRVRTAEGLRTVVNAALALRGTAQTPSLEGNLQVIDLSFEESFDAFLTLFGGSLGGSDPQGSLDQLALALHVAGDRNIRVENEVVSVDARLDLDIAGTLGDPTMTGHIESTEGNLNFQGSRYRITRGAVDFVDPLGIEPLIDIQAETELRDYRIILAITGRGDDVRLDMRSDPPLPQLEIVSLVAGGRTREELAQDRPDASLVPTSEQLFTGGAATILTDLLRERVGSRLGVLGRVRIDPFLVGAENNPVARVTISEQITRDLAITYSQDLSSSRQQIILIEYFLNNDTSFIASRDETGALGVDIRLRKRFR
jgi:hypothetical protein